MTKMAEPWEPTKVGGSALTTREINVLVTMERIGAGFSMVAIIILVVTYLMFKRLRTTPNLFLFCAALANVGASVASMMGYDGLDQGEESALCQAQSFIFQWYEIFMSSTVDTVELTSSGLCRQTLGGRSPWLSMSTSSSSTMSIPLPSASMHGFTALYASVDLSYLRLL